MWKDKCYEESKGLSVKDYLNKIHNNVQETLKDSGFIEKDGKLEKKLTGGRKKIKSRTLFYKKD